MMRSLLNWDPFREMAPFPADERAFGFVPTFEVKETKEGFEFRADIPGVKEADLEVTVTGNRLTVSGKRDAEHKEESDTFYAYERTYGSFSRSFTLPEGADTGRTYADMKDGVLKLTIPRKPELAPQRIAVKSGNLPKS
jgi:HSP20 family protein